MCIMSSDSTIPCSTATRLKVRALKRAGESYDELLQKMTDQYDPKAAGDDAPECTGADR